MPNIEVNYARIGQMVYRSRTMGNDNTDIS